MVAVAITRADHDAAGLRAAASRSCDGAAARRMLALALVLDGHARSDAARLCGMDRQTLRDWVHRYNEQGLAGLSDRQGRSGPARRLSAEQEAAVAALVARGPDRAEHGVVRWRRVDLAAVIAQRFGVHLAERTVGKLLRRLGFVRLSVRPRHPAHDAAAQEAHKKTLPTWSPRRSRSTPAASRSNSGGRTRRASASKAP
jgi:transposase